MILGSLATNFHVDPIIFGAQTCYLACFVASLWRLGKAWGDSWTLGTQERPLSCPVLDFIASWQVKGPHFETFLMSRIGELSILQRRHCKAQLSQKLEF